MDLIKYVAYYLLNNYYIYSFILPSEAVCFLLERAAFKGYFNRRERFNFYFTSTLINFILGNALEMVYLQHFSENKYHYFFVILFIAAGFITGIILSLILKNIIHALRKKTVNRIFKENVYGFVIFGIFIVKFFLSIPYEVKPWHAWCYSTDWSMGISSRFLAGQILSTFCKDFVSGKNIFLFCFFVGLLLIIIVSAMINSLIKKADAKTKPAVFFICLCFVSCPLSISSMFSDTNFGRLEVFGLILSLISVAAFNKIRNTTFKYFAVTVLSVLGIMFYQGYVFLYYNIVLVVIIFDVIDKEAVKIKNAVYGTVSIVISFVTFLYFQLFSQIKFQTSEQMVNALRERTNIEINKMPIELEYFSGLQESYKLVTNYINDSARLFFLVQILFMIPLIYLLALIIYNCFCIEKKKDCKFNFLRLRNALCLMSLLLVLPQFLLNVDWGRWLIAVFTFVFFYILYFSYQKDYSMQIVLEKLSEKVIKRPVLCALFCIFLSAFGNVKAMFFPDAQKIISFINMF